MKIVHICCRCLLYKAWRIKPNCLAPATPWKCLHKCLHNKYNNNNLFNSHEAEKQKYVPILLLHTSWKFGCFIFDDRDVIVEILSTQFVGKKKRKKEEKKKRDEQFSGSVLCYILSPPTGGVGLKNNTIFKTELLNSVYHRICTSLLLLPNSQLIKY